MMKWKSIWLIAIFCVSIVAQSFCATLPQDSIILGLLPSYKIKESGSAYYGYQASFTVKKSGTLKDVLTVFDQSLQFKQWDSNWVINKHPQNMSEPLQADDTLKTNTIYYIHAKLTYTGPLQLSEKQTDQCRPVVLLVPISGITKIFTQYANSNPFGISSLSPPKPNRINRDQVDIPVNFIFFMIDTLRADHTPLYGHPFVIATHMEMLANLGTVFTNSYGASSSTRPSVGTMMSGLQPYAHGAVRHSLTNANLYSSVPHMADIFLQHDFVNIGISSNSQVTSAFGFSRGFFNYLCPVRENQVTPFALDQFDTVNEPFFMYLHYMAPHAPYFPPYQLFTIYDGLTEYPEQDRYCAEITLDDQRVGLVLRKLAETGMINHSVMWLVSDHGEEFWEHGWNGHGAKLFEESVRTVSILTAPHFYPMQQTIDQPVMHSDMLSTVCDIFDWNEPEIQQGRSLMPLVINPETDVEERPIFLHHGGGLAPKPHPSDKNAVVLENNKLIWWTQKGEWELYNLENDPLEQHNLANTQLDTIEKLKPVLMKQLSDTKTLGETFRSETGAEALDVLTDRDIQNLRSNGYLGN